MLQELGYSWQMDCARPGVSCIRAGDKRGASLPSSLTNTSTPDRFTPFSFWQTNYNTNTTPIPYFPLSFHQHLQCHVISIPRFSYSFATTSTPSRFDKINFNHTIPEPFRQKSSWSYLRNTAKEKWTRIFCDKAGPGGGAGGEIACFSTWVISTQILQLTCSLGWVCVWVWVGEPD